MYTMRRTQIYLAEDQHRRMASRAEDEGTTTSELIRRAIDMFLDGTQRARGLDDVAAFRQAIARLYEQPAVDLPPGEEYVERLRTDDAARLAELDRQWGDQEDVAAG